jgi:hypothetical protein
MRVKQYNASLEGKFRVPQNLSLERKIIWYQNKYREVMLNNSFSQAKKKNFEKYTEALEQAIDYILGIGDYRKLTNEARRIIMFLLSTRKAWVTSKSRYRKKPEEILKFLNADLILDIRKQIILDFLSGWPASDANKTYEEKERQKRKPFQDWEIEILLNEELNSTQAMYMIGRTHDSVRAFRIRKNFKERED